MDAVSPTSQLSLNSLAYEAKYNWDRIYANFKWIRTRDARFASKFADLCAIRISKIKNAI